jgi:glycosyltransferase involved in cell wall biosynthesis
MADLTAIIMTKNESENIEACLKSIQDFAKRIVILDCGSTDNTVELAKQYGTDIYFHEFEYYAKQFNWGIDNTNISTKWILRLDADERFTPELCKESEKLMNLHENDNVNGITMEAKLFFLGKWLKHVGTAKRKMMIFKAGIGRIEDRKRDAHSILSSGTSICTKEKFLHYDFKDINSFINKYNWYATRELYDYLDYKQGNDINVKTDLEIQKQRQKKFGLYYKSPEFWRASWWFFLKYYLRGGLLDGKEGLIYSFFEFYWYRFLVDAKIYEQEKIGTKVEELKALGE